MAQSTLERFGSNWGGWTINSSLVRDGDLILSGGIADDTSFEASMLKRFKVKFIGIDPTEEAQRHVSKHSGELRSNFVFLNVAIAGQDCDTFTPCDSRKLYKSRCLGNLINDNDFSLIKLDIEGGEYEALESITDYKNVKQIAVEFHHWVPAYGKTISQTYNSISKLKKDGFKLVFHKVNVPERKIQECLFIRSDLTNLPEVIL